MGAPDKWPYEYGSDLHWLWGWGAKIRRRLDDDKPADEYDWIVFRPTRQATAAMMRFSIKYSHISKQIDDVRDFAEKRFSDFKTNQDESSSVNFLNAMDSLSKRILFGVETIAKQEAADEPQAPGPKVIFTLQDPKPDPTLASYAVDCRCVNWYGTVHRFTPTQAACVKVLIEHYKHGVPEVGEQTVLSSEWVETSQQRLASVFDNGKHSAWGTMITSGSGKGTVRLTKPGE